MMRSLCNRITITRIFTNGFAASASLIRATLALLVVYAAPVYAAPPDSETSSTFIWGGASYAYTAFIPGNRPAHPALVVNLHGCGGSPASQAASTGMNAIAAREGFIVLYPDGNLVNKALVQCWGAVATAPLESRTSGDAPAIAAMTRQVAQQFDVDPNRIYLVGMSAGGLETSMVGAYFPDLFAAIGIHSGAPFMGAAGCFASLVPTVGASEVAAAAYQAESVSRRVIPTIVLHGDADTTVPYFCGVNALMQWGMTNNSVLAIQGATQISRDPTDVRSGTANSVNGLPYEVSSWTLPGSSCHVLEFWRVQGLGHNWSGQLATGGPSASEATWSFFSAIERTNQGYRCRSGQPG